MQVELKMVPKFQVTHFAIAQTTEGQKNRKPGWLIESNVDSIRSWFSLSDPSMNVSSGV
jgi:hypothetical protein